MASDSNSDGRLVLNDQNHGALIVIFTATWMVWTLGVLIVRLIGKTKFRTSVDLEEISVIFSSLLGFGCSSIIFAAVSSGLGKQAEIINEANILSTEKALYAADLLYLFTLGVSKAATIFLIQRLTRVKGHILACHGIALLLLAWTVAAILTLGIRCNTAFPWLSRNSATCPNLFSRWIAIEAIGMTIELLMIGLAAHIVFNLQMPIKMKVKGTFAFMTRLPLCAIISLRLYYLHTAFSTDDFTFAMTNPTIVTQSALHFSIIAASFAYLMPFLSVFDSNLGATVKLDTLNPSSYAKNSRSGKSGFGVKSSSGRSGITSVQAPDPEARNGDRGINGVRTSSQDSKAPIIMKTQTYEVQYET